MVIWCTASTLKMMKLNWRTVTIFNNHDCSSSMHNEGTWITWQHIHFLSYCNFLAIFKWWPVNNFSFRKTDFNFSRQYFISALIRNYLFSTKQKKKSKVRLRVFMHLYGQTTNPLWSRFENRTIRSVHLSIWFTLDKRKIKREKRDIVMQKNWWREGLGRAGQGGTENFGAYSSWALTFTPDLSLKGKLWVNTCSTSCSLLQTIQLEEKEKQSFLFSTGKTGTFRAQGEENRCFTPCNY